MTWNTKDKRLKVSDMSINNCHYCLNLIMLVNKALTDQIIFNQGFQFYNSMSIYKAAAGSAVSQPVECTRRLDFACNIKPVQNE